jgi:hypothetical protein
LAKQNIKRSILICLIYITMSVQWQYFSQEFSQLKSSQTCIAPIPFHQYTEAIDYLWYKAENHKTNNSKRKIFSNLRDCIVQKRGEKPKHLTRINWIKASFSDQTFSTLMMGSRYPWRLISWEVQIINRHGPICSTKVNHENRHHEKFDY